LLSGVRPIARRAEALRRRIWRRTGVRLAVVQVLVVLASFGVAGVMTRADIHQSNQRTLQREIGGEMASLQDEIVRMGEPRLPATVERRTRLWRGFEYGLVTPDGQRLGGRLMSPRERLGWSRVRGRGAWGANLTFLALTARTPSGAWLSVGKNLAEVEHETLMVTWRLIAASACGVVVCVAACIVFGRPTWRRLAAMSNTAHLVAEGRLNVRVPAARPGGPDDIDELGVALNVMLDRIGGLVGQLRRVTTDVAHDLRTPLTRMRQRLERLERARDLADHHRQSVASAHADLLELLRTFDALLQLAEIEGRSLADEQVILDLSEVTCRVSEAFRPDVEESGRRLEIDTGPGPVLVAGDSALLAQMVANLIENALRHTPVGSTIRVAVGAGAEGPCLTVADDGDGIPSHMRQAVLAPYFRLDESRGTAGSGLGLSIVAAVAARHRARLELGDNEPGLAVTVVFPPPDARRAARAARPSETPLSRAA
jgi:signal transduction histidine kinase